VRHCPEILVKWPWKMTEALDERAKTPRRFGMEVFGALKKTLLLPLSILIWYIKT